MASPNLEKLKEIDRKLIDPDLAVQLFEELPDAVVIVDDLANIKLINKQAELMFGYHREDIIGSSVEILIPEHLREAHANQRNDYFRDPRTRPMGAGSQLLAQRKDGSQFEAEISISPMRTREGTFVAAVIRKRRDA